MTTQRVLCMLFAMLCVFVGRTAGAEKPLNVMFITLDDMNRDSIGVYGCSVEGTTPNIDQLAAEGLAFDQAHVTIAICQPTRAVWMTGRYPHNNGALGFNPIKRGIPTLPETLKAHGYTTGILGKTEHVVPSRKDAFDYRRARNEMNNGRDAELYGQFTAEFLAQADKAGKPFFLMVNAHDPHRPFDNLRPADRRRVQRGAAPAKQERGRRGRGGDYPAPSRIFKPDQIEVPGFLPELPDIRREITQYYSSVRRADDVVGRVLAELDKAGLRKNTVVMLKSDHGIAVPFAKTNVYRHSTITPWIVRWPGTVRPGTRDTTHLVSGIDFAPTVLDLLGLPAMEGVDGRSLLPLLKGDAQSGRERVFTHINTLSSGRSYAMRSVQDKRYGLIWNAWSDGETTFRNESMSGYTWRAMVRAAKDDPKIAERVKLFAYRVPFEFYDYQQDPDARHNRIDDPQLQDKIAAFRKELHEHLKSTGDPELKRFLEQQRNQ